MNQQPPYQGPDRRQTPKINDTFYRLVVASNLIAWVVFLAAMVVFHYARPELVTGVQSYWGLEIRDHWSGSLTFYLLVLLGLCVAMSITTLLMKRMRSRRKEDFLGVNIFILLVVASASLLWIYFEVQALKPNTTQASYNSSGSPSGS